MARPSTPSPPSGATPLGVGAGILVIHLAASGFCLFFGLKAAAARPGTVSLTAVQLAHDAARVLGLPLAAAIGLGGIAVGPDLAVWAKLGLNSAAWALAAGLLAWAWQRRPGHGLGHQVEGRP